MTGLLVRTLNNIVGRFNHVSHVWLFLLTLLFGTIIRLAFISELPSGLNQDEASIAYEAFCLMTDGMDRNGVSWPVHFISWGSGQNALYAYMLIPLFKVFGIATWVVRLPNALLHSLSLWLFYLVMRTTFSRRRSLSALALLAICPWSIMCARWGLEAHIFPPLFLLAFFLLLKGGAHSWCYLLSAAVFALSLYSYGTSYLVVPLFLLSASAILLWQGRISWTVLLSSVTVFCVVALPIGCFVFVNQFGLDSMTVFGLSAPHLPFSRMDALSSADGGFVKTIVSRCVRSFAYLFSQSDKRVWNVLPNFGLVYQIGLPFAIVGVWQAVVKVRARRASLLDILMLLWFGVSLVLCLAIFVEMHRINIIGFPLVFFTAVGLWTSLTFLQSQYVRRAKVFFVSFFSVSFVVFVMYYFMSLSHRGSGGFGYHNVTTYGQEDAFRHLDSHYPSDTIYVSVAEFNMPYITVCLATQMPPEQFRRDVRYVPGSLDEAGFAEVSQIGRWRFVSQPTDAMRPLIISQQEADILCPDEQESHYFGRVVVLEHK